MSVTWQDEQHEIKLLPKLHKGRTRIMVVGPTGIQQPTVRPGAGEESARMWRTYRRGIIRVYRQQASEALARLVGLSLDLELRSRPRDGLTSYFVADVDLGCDLFVRIKP